MVKAFSQGERSYAKFAQAVSSFRDFTLNWFRCTWASMNLCLSILPTTLLGTLPVGIYLYQTGVLDPAQVTLCLMMALGIVSPLMRATAFINSMKSMQFAVKDTRELLDLPQLSQAKQEADLDGSGIRFRNVAFSYGGTGGAEVLHDLELHDLWQCAGIFKGQRTGKGDVSAHAYRLQRRFHAAAEAVQDKGSLGACP